MVFSSPLFLFFFLPLILICTLFVRNKISNLLLLVASLFFYAWGERIYVVVMLFSILVNYGFGRWLIQFQNRRKTLLYVGILLNLLLLTYFKYANFLIENVNHLLATFSLDVSLQKIQNLRLPIGISFFTFQGLSYLIDVYRGDTAPQKNVLKLGLYISLFPQLIAGPIVRYVDVEHQIDHRTRTPKARKEGVERFIIGLAKKVIIANCFASVADYIFNLPTDQLSQSLTWVGILAYTFQIYYDFSGYSDMAIGIGKMLGFEFLENFNYPYISKSIQEFWRRWHISLSSWFRDYVYIPLGGSKVGKWKIYRNLLIVFFVTGLWHGASWNFIVWGMFHGAFLLLERILLGKYLIRIPSLFAHAYTLLVVIVGWVFFRAEDLSQAIQYLEQMFLGEWNTPKSWSHLTYLYSNELLLVSFLAILFSMPVIRLLSSWFAEQKIKVQVFYSLALFGLFYMVILYLSASTYNPFIYFRF